MKILFAGTPKSSAAILGYLLSNDTYDIVGVITQTDKPGKRGNKIISSPVSNIAFNNNINIFKPKSLNETLFRETINGIDIDIILVVAYGKIIPEWLLKSAKIMAINIHFSLLPKYRGASPIQSAILNGEDKTGVSFIEMNNKMDEGNILQKNDINIEKGDNKKDLEDKLTDLSINNIDSLLLDIVKKKNKLEIQNDLDVSYCTKILKSDGITDFNDNASRIYNKYKAYIEWPGLSFLHKDILIKIHELRVTEHKSLNRPGSIHKIDKSGIYINTIDNMIVITHLQFPNKKIISGLDVFNSYKKFFE
ncbi:MAG: methionyl-tRNA formyltransferase [Gammaproteobacteria bacterium]|nr:methionyl-tRNA formyltransferase [Gammaproteobacteria bacterium]|tara:strand:+ start:1890 stop:2810 length:921 start_codon:yes stop_codon:yes gene_type:complete